MAREFRFNRVLLKISGEALKGTQEHGYDADAVRTIVERVKAVADQGVERILTHGGAAGTPIAEAPRPLEKSHYPRALLANANGSDLPSPVSPKCRPPRLLRAPPS